MSLWDCECVDAPLRLRRIRSGGIQYVHQCQQCGRQVGGAVKSSVVCADSLPPEWQDAIADRWTESRRIAYLRQREGMEADREAALTERKARYQEYLQTSAWQVKRKAVLERERYVCQGCRVNRALEVHHLSYENIGDELLFQLVAVCRECHSKAHGVGDVEHAA